MTWTRRISSGAAVAGLLVAGAGGGTAQMAPATQRDLTMTPGMRGEVIDGALKRLNESYVLPEVAKQMEVAIRQRVANKEYDGITSAKVFVDSLTRHLRAVSHDKHLSVMYLADPMPAPTGGGPTPEQRERMRAFASSVNFGFERVERLPGNIGYLKLTGFMPPDVAGETAAAAMNFLANTEALIIDLRVNGGGDPAMVAFLSSYLFDQATHLNDIYWRAGDFTRQSWTLPFVPGKRYGAKDVYVLTSTTTFSAGEEFTNNLKALKRATIVGETTGGGANPGGPQPLNDHFAVWIPTGRAINPITKTNWEGTGVAPDVATSAARALPTAYLAALEKAQPKANPRMADEIKQLTDSLRRDLGTAHP